MADIEDLDLTTWNSVIDINLTGSFFRLRANSAKVMKQARRGVIILTASGAGVLGGSASIAYAQSKGGVHGLTMVLAIPIGEVRDLRERRLPRESGHRDDFGRPRTGFPEYRSAARTGDSRRRGITFHV